MKINDFKIGFVFKYHNKIVEVIKKTTDQIIVKPHFADELIGNLEFKIPKTEIGNINIRKIATKPKIQEILKEIYQGKSNKNWHYFFDRDKKIRNFSLKEAAIGIRLLIDQRSKNPRNFPPNKSSKLRQLIAIAVKEVGVGLNLNDEKSNAYIRKHIQKRHKAQE